MPIRSEQRGAVELVTMAGRLDAAIAERSATELEALLAAGRKQLVVDMEQVDFVDSTGLSILVRIAKAARSAGGDLVLFKPSQQIRSILRLTRLDRVLRIVDTLDEAPAGADLGPGA